MAQGIPSWRYCPECGRLMHDTDLRRVAVQCSCGYVKDVPADVIAKRTGAPTLPGLG